MIHKLYKNFKSLLGNFWYFCGNFLTFISHLKINFDVQFIKNFRSSKVLGPNYNIK